MEKLAIKKFYRGKKVLVTGNTGFKGSWLCELLLHFGAEVFGFALTPPTSPSLHDILGHKKLFQTTIADVRDRGSLKETLKSCRPDIVIHMAAQPIVLAAYENPVETYEINVMGTVNVLEALRHADSVRSFLNVTTDKVYRNNEWEWGYRETDPLDGFDPYSNSKSCSELVTRSFRDSFFSYDCAPAISTARAGNVIGGGDFSDDRIIPDCFRAVSEGKKIKLRNPHSIRPYQHVLEPVFAYLGIAKAQYENRQSAGSYNVGPSESDCVTTECLTKLFCEKWGYDRGYESAVNENAPHEANFLRLDSSRIINRLGYIQTWNIETAILKTVEVYKIYLADGDAVGCVRNQIKEFIDYGEKN